MSEQVETFIKKAKTAAGMIQADLAKAVEGFTASEASPLLFASLLFTAICKAPQTAILLFCLSFPWGSATAVPPGHRA